MPGEVEKNSDEHLLLAARKWAAEQHDKFLSRQPQQLDGKLKFVVKQLGLNKRGKLSHVREAWLKVVPDEIRAAAFLGSYRNGILTVAVENSALRAELEQFHKPALVEELRKHLPASAKLRDIRFTAG